MARKPTVEAAWERPQKQKLNKGKTEITSDLANQACGFAWSRTNLQLQVLRIQQNPDYILGVCVGEWTLALALMVLSVIWVGRKRSENEEVIGSARWERTKKGRFLPPPWPNRPHLLPLITHLLFFSFPCFLFIYPLYLHFFYFSFVVSINI